MEIKDIQKTEEKKSIVVSVRITKANSQWLMDNNLSPTKLFNKAIEELKESEK